MRPAVLAWHGHIGVAQQRVHVAPVFREDADADADRGIERDAAHAEGLRQRHQDVLGGGGQPAMLEIGQQHDELVARQPADDVGGARQPPQPQRDLAQQRVADGMPQRVVDLLEAVQVQEQHRHALALGLGAGDGLLGLGQQQIAVGQPGQFVVEGQLADAGARFLALQRQRAQVDADIHQAVMKVVGQPALAEIEAESADDSAIAGLDRRGPAGLDVLRQRQAIAVPQRIGGDIRHDDRPAQEGGSAAGAALRADRLAVQRVAERRRQAGRGQRPQPPGIVHPQHGGQHLGRQAFDLAAHHVHHFGDRCLVDHGLQHAALQHLMHLGRGDIGQHIHHVDQRAALVEHGVGHDRHP